MPHYHRLHHSADPRYFNANYAALFPAFDWLFGTAKPGLADEYPATGLDTGDTPITFRDAVLWPWRKQPDGGNAIAGLLVASQGRSSRHRFGTSLKGLVVTTRLH